MNESGDTSQDATNKEPYSANKQLIAGIIVLIVLVTSGILVYQYISTNFLGKSGSNKGVLDASTTQITPIQSLPSQNTQNITTNTTPNNTQATEGNTSPTGESLNNKTCVKNGPAQKWEYLVPYVVKDGDTLQSIATAQLNDATRVNEIMQINGQGPYVVGSTLYLPPSSITKSSGNIKQVSGMLVSKDSSYWHISFSSDPKGLGIIIPSFWFDGVSNTDSFTVGDCITVLLDDGNKVFSVALQ